MKKMGWHFPADKFTGSAGVKNVSGYQRGGKVQRHTDKMAHKPDVDAMAKGGKVNWIAGAIKHPGALHKELGVPQGEKIPAKKLSAAASKGGVEGKRARLAETLKGMHKADGGKVAAKDVHKHEKHLHKGEPMTKLAKGGHVKKSAHKTAPRAAGPSPMAQAAMAANLEPPPGPPMGAPPMGPPPGGPPMGMKKGGMAKAKKGC